MFKYLLLGISQGITEFLPVSSSGHLVVLQHILGVKEQPLFIIVVLHLATLFSLVIYFFRDLLQALKNFKLMFYIFIATLITAIIALAGKDFFTSMFSSVKMIALSFFVTGLILIFTKKFTHPQKSFKEITLTDTLIFGVAQAVAIIPAISRSGITIAALLFRKVDREAAFKFSFLVSVPAIAGAFILELKDVNFNLAYFSWPLVLGSISAFILGLLSLYFLKIILRKDKFYYFGYYCIIVAIFCWLFLR